MTVYLAGKITGDEKYRQKFREAAKRLSEAGFIVVNPAILPYPGFEYEAYIRISMAMLDECEAVCFLPDWVNSKGAIGEFNRAKTKKKIMFFFNEWDGTMPEKKRMSGNARYAYTE